MGWCRVIYIVIIMVIVLVLVRVMVMVRVGISDWLGLGYGYHMLRLAVYGEVFYYSANYMIQLAHTRPQKI